MAEQTNKAIRITLIKSPIGYTVRQKATVRALGLRKMGQSVVKTDTPAVRGMVAAVSHLLQIEENVDA